VQSADEAWGPSTGVGSHAVGWPCDGGGGAAGSCHNGARVDSLDRRLGRIETLLGVVDAGAVPSADTAVATAFDAGAVPGDDSAALCALARVTAYQAWQEAIARAKAIAAPAQAARSDFWSDSKKQVLLLRGIGGRAHDAGRARRPRCTGVLASRAPRGFC
jgi:hypothetical protein